MQLKSGKSKEIIDKNIMVIMDKGFSEEQAQAIAYSKAGKKKPRPNPKPKPY